MFDGNTYAGYVAADAPREARSRLEAMSSEEVNRRGMDELVEVLFQAISIVPVSYDVERSGWESEDPNDETRVRLKLRLTLGGSATAEAFLGLTPSQSTRIRGRASVQQPYLVVEGVPASEVAQVMGFYARTSISCIRTSFRTK